MQLIDLLKIIALNLCIHIAKIKRKENIILTQPFMAISCAQQFVDCVLSNVGWFSARTSLVLSKLIEKRFPLPRDLKSDAMLKIKYNTKESEYNTI